jgi:DNA-binding MarR family transcriptional regulator
MRFALSYPASWHTYGKDRSTVNALHSLEAMGFIEISRETRQFRLNLSERARAAVDAANANED